MDNVSRLSASLVSSEIVKSHSAHLPTKEGGFRTCAPACCERLHGGTFLTAVRFYYTE